LPGSALASATSFRDALDRLLRRKDEQRFAAMKICEIGAKSFAGSNGSVSKQTLIDDQRPIAAHQQRVAVGGQPWRTRSVAMLLPAPGIFSTTNGRAPGFPQKPVGKKCAPRRQARCRA